MKPTHQFFQQKPAVVARKLLGKKLVRKIDTNKELSGIIIETEAYLPENDPVAHASRGRTKANNSVFETPGTWYVYAIHRYHCLSMSCYKSDMGGAILIRAVEPIDGIERMQKNRKKVRMKDLTSGPGKLCMAFGIDKSFDGVDMLEENSKLYIAEYSQFNDNEIEITGRVGVSEDHPKPLRFVVKDSEFRSR